jgi:hypothetical protein
MKINWKWIAAGAVVLGGSFLAFNHTQAQAWNTGRGDIPQEQWDALHHRLDNIEGALELIRQAQFFGVVLEAEDVQTWAPIADALGQGLEGWWPDQFDAIDRRAFQLKRALNLGLVARSNDQELTPGTVEAATAIANEIAQYVQGDD